MHNFLKYTDYYHFNDSKYFQIHGRFDECNNNTVYIDWPGTCIDFSLEMVHTNHEIDNDIFNLSSNVSSAFYLCMNGGGNIFNVYINSDNHNKSFRVITDKKKRIYKIPLIFNSIRKLFIRLVKISEPRFKSILSDFRTSKLYYIKHHRFVVDGLLPKLNIFKIKMIKNSNNKMKWFEIIGDSDSVGFGNEVTSPTNVSNILSIDYLKTNIINTWGWMLYRRLQKYEYSPPHIIAYSGKGICRNAPFMGSSTMVDLYRLNTIISENPSVNISLDKPDFILLLVGGNDYAEHPPPKDEEFINKYSILIHEIYDKYDKDICIIPCCLSPNCQSSEGGISTHPKSVQRVIDDCKDLARKIQIICDTFNLLFCQIDVDLDLPNDFGLLMHWSVNGHLKIAHFIHEFLYENGVIHTPMDDSPFYPEKIPIDIIKCNRFRDIHHKIFKLCY